ncbi:hypothetical protein ACR77J_15230 [Tissierella praeacuta]|uniref:hypothetical protein n=1 Tax=Tissierella praeacuta TaxID=43131 RepID=UPI0028AA5AED|nr:hypothetical protein [Tissierella praeacuta]
MNVLNRKEVERDLIELGFKDIKRVFSAFSNNLWCVKNERINGAKYIKGGWV